MFYFESVADFIAMCYVKKDGTEMCHGAYVWSAYGIALVVLITAALAPLQRNRGVRKAILRQMRREAAAQSQTQTPEKSQAEDF
ncbi:heme exporter protein CcmD [Porticoccus sp. W117]|uniref:heme exporter protein CcmD n=1 Tax=Porticoccus sp. W117 TaxID=3054777 RepID=UPI0025990531|nr:heme exporter protein CcmD [Porticoccus sp. W117]MDM3869780.1 heme exporter protein CcmD [Porticoccus sp. W117]